MGSFEMHRSLHGPHRVFLIARVLQFLIPGRGRGTWKLQQHGAKEGVRRVRMEGHARCDIVIEIVLHDWRVIIAFLSTQISSLEAGGKVL